MPEDMRIDDGVIRVVKNLAYGSGATAIARVMLAFTTDVEPPDVQTEGTSLLVRVAKPAGAAVAAAGRTPWSSGWSGDVRGRRRQGRRQGGRRRGGAQGGAGARAARRRRQGAGQGGGRGERQGA